MVNRFSDVIGHDDLKKYMKMAINKEKVAHTYILNGESGSGKTILTNLFVLSLMCEMQNTDAEPCGECDACRKIQGNNHPDVITLQKEKKDYRIEEVREQLNNDIGLRPYSSDKKIYIIPDAEKMTPLVQNAILKTLEEPPEYAIIILQTANVEGMLQTIKSRSVILQLKSVRDTQVIKYLMERERLPDYEAKICASFAQGNIGKAIKLARSASFREVKDQVITMMTEIRECRSDKMDIYIKNAVEIKSEILEYLDLVTIWIRDALIYKSTKNMNIIIFQQNITHIKKFTQVYSYDGLEKILKEIEVTKNRLKANVKFELAIELLLRTIKEC